jgi:hypothetical protein
MPWPYFEVWELYLKELEGTAVNVVNPTEA